MGKGNGRLNLKSQEAAVFPEKKNNDHVFQFVGLLIGEQVPTLTKLKFSIEQFPNCYDLNHLFECI